MSTGQALTGSIAANNIHKWMRAWHQGSAPDAIDLDLVRQMLPDNCTSVAWTFCGARMAGWVSVTTFTTTR